MVVAERRAEEETPRRVGSRPRPHTTVPLFQRLQIKATTAAASRFHGQRMTPQSGLDAKKTTGRHDPRAPACAPACVCVCAPTTCELSEQCDSPMPERVPLKAALRLVCALGCQGGFWGCFLDCNELLGFNLQLCYSQLHLPCCRFCPRGATKTITRPSSNETASTTPYSLGVTQRH